MNYEKMEIDGLLASQKGFSDFSEANYAFNRVGLFLSPQIYFLLDGDMQVVYVGMTETNVLARLNSHVSDKDKKFEYVSFLKCPTHMALRDVENALISYFKPKYNVTGNSEHVSTKTFNIISWFISEYRGWYDKIVDGPSLDCENCAKGKPECDDCEGPGDE
jgi:hypothetical protein